MELAKTIFNVLNKIFIIVPILLFLLSIFLALTYGFTPESFVIRQAIWTSFWHIAYFYYLLTAPIIFILFWIKEKDKNIKEFFKTYRNWLIGFLLSMFSFAIVGFATDIIMLLLLVVTHKTS